MSKTLEREASIDTIRRERRAPAPASDPPVNPLADWLTPDAEASEPDAMEAVIAPGVAALDFRLGTEALDRLDARINDFAARVDALHAALRNRLAAAPQTSSRSNDGNLWGVLALVAVAIAFAVVAVPYALDVASRPETPGPLPARAAATTP